MQIDAFSQHSLMAALPSWVPEVRFLNQTDSTNRVAREWAAAGAPHGCLVVADHQTAGRGRLDRSWLVPAGSSLLFTVILRPKMARERLGLVNLAAAVAVCEAVAKLGFEPRVKWPNDVNLPGGKVAGILSDVVGDAVCVGVGLNVNVKEFAEEISQVATSLALESGRQFDRQELLVAVLNGLNRLCGADTEDHVLTAYRRWCETLGTKVRIELADRTIGGRAQDVDSSGALIMDSGEAINAGDVVHLKE